MILTVWSLGGDAPGVDFVWIGCHEKQRQPLFYHVRLGRLMFYTDFDPSLPLDFQPGGIVARSLLDVTLPSLCLAFHGLLGQPVALDPEVASTLAEVGGWGWKYH